MSFYTVFFYVILLGFLCSSNLLYLDASDEYQNDGVIIVEKLKNSDGKNIVKNIEENYEYLQQGNKQKESIQKSFTKRVLQSSEISSTFITSCSTLFQYILPLLRNLIIIGILTNSLDTFLPYILLSQSFLMLAFWPCEKHHLNLFYSNTFASYLDIFNALRLLFRPAAAAPNLIQFSRYGYTSIAILNLSGELLIAVLLLVLSVLAQAANGGYLKKISSNLRSIWNGYFFAIFPRVATLTGLHWREFGHGGGLDALNGITCALLTALMVAYFVLLLLQIRKIGKRPAFLEYSRWEVGLLKRVDWKGEVSFDFFYLSNLYYPCVNYLRLFVYYFPIGLAWNCQELTYGGPLLSQFFILMIQISSNYYSNLRDRIFFPLQNIFLMIIQISLITIGLMQTVPSSQISQKMEVVIFSGLLLIIGTSLGMTLVEVWKSRVLWSNRISQEEVLKGGNDTTNMLQPASQKKKVGFQQDRSDDSGEKSKGQVVSRCEKSGEKSECEDTKQQENRKIRIKKTLDGKNKTNLFFL